MSEQDSTQQDTPLTYQDAGVDIDAGNAMVESLKAITEQTKRPEILSGIGGFAALSRLPDKYQEPVLVAGTDGVGTKLKLAIELGRHEDLGRDLVAMSVNDILVTGAEPLLFLDYFATSKLNPQVVTQVVRGIGAACIQAGCTLAGGETAEMPGLYRNNDYDVAGFCLGVVEKKDIIDGHKIAAGDLLVGLASSGPHANGFSFIRMILERAKINLATAPDLAEQLLASTHIYAAAVKRLIAEVSVLGMAHITGGGLTDNLPRMLPKQAALAMAVDLTSWQQPEVFNWLQAKGNISNGQMLRTFNCGVGMVICIRESEQQAAIKSLEAAGATPFVIGRVQAANKPGAAVQFHGS